MKGQLDLVNKIKEYNPNVNVGLISRAFDFSKLAHSHQIRASGEPYITHPLAVAEILIELKLDSESIVAALLHDTVEDTNVTIKSIESSFGKDVALLVEGLTKLNKIAFQSDNLRQAENFRKFLLAMSKDIRILLIKIADRLHNMRTLSHVTKIKRVKIAKETLEIYAPLTERIGMHAIKDELQDLAFAEINNEARLSILQRLEYIRETGGQDIISKYSNKIYDIINGSNIPCKVYGREKKAYSIWLKMKVKNISFEQLSDIMAFRIIVPDIHQCYQILGYIHQKYHMVPGKFKDYISTPKSNGYQSLHTTIIGPSQQKIEIQIRTELMHQIAEYGIAAHWSYKNEISKNNLAYNNYWINELLHILEESHNIEDFFHNTRLEMYSDQVFCFSPKGELKVLPSGATPVDFAYAIHSEVGNSCMGSKINGVIVPLRTQLKNGDQVEIINSQNQKPSESWEEFVVTGKARTHIRKYFRELRHKDYVALGEEILYKFFKDKKLAINDKILGSALKILSKDSIESVYIDVAEGIMPRMDVLKACYPKYENDIKNIKKKTFWKIFDKKQNKVIQNKQKVNAKAIKGSIPGIDIDFCNYCYPIPGDRIIGVMHSGKGILVHRNNCSHIKRSITKDNIITISWDKNEKIKNKFIVQIKCVIAKKNGAIAKVIEIINSCNINIDNFKIISQSDVYIESYIDIEVSDIKDLHFIKASLRSNKLVFTVDRNF